MLAIAGLLALSGSSTASILKNFTSPNINVNRGIISEISSGCPTTGTASCGTTGRVSCSRPSSGDTNPSTGPSNSWTIHGLWPDECNLSFQENCDPSRAYTGISSLLTAQGASSTPQLHEYPLWMFRAFPLAAPRAPKLWHSSKTVMRLFQTLPTYEWLANQGITPSSSTTHTLASLTAAIKTEYGFTPSFDCDGSDLSGASYYFHLIGSVIDGTFVPINAPESGSCGSTGIKYLTKTGSPVTTTSTSTTTKSTSTTTTTTTSGGGGSTGTPIPLPATAFIEASTGGGLLTLASPWSPRKAWNCGVSGGELTCGSGVSLGTFTARPGLRRIIDGVPSGSTVFTVFTGSSHANAYTLAIVTT
ncbi:RNase Gf29 [Mycena olivaceomarginata]|nr:RNase Gf29 [Mycena olivaceomarginata]